MPTATPGGTLLCSFGFGVWWAGHGLHEAGGFCPCRVPSSATSARGQLHAGPGLFQLGVGDPYCQPEKF